MLSRRHIRIKVMQALYMYYNDGNDNLGVSQLSRTLEKNISKLYELYLYLLLFVEETGAFSRQYDEESRSKYIQPNEEQKAQPRFFNNPVIKRLAGSGIFHNKAEQYKVSWNADGDLLRRVFFDLKNQDIYQEYMQFAAEKPVLGQEVILFLLKHYTSHFPLMQHHLEEEFYNWLDDKKIALQMASKTIQAIAGQTEGEEEDFLLPLSQNDDENFEFATELLKLTLKQEDKINGILATRIVKWESHQIARIDNIILKMAVCEFLNFPSIPSKVTINEYIELAKNYSTPQSKKFVNGVLDMTQKELRKDGLMLKS